MPEPKGPKSGGPGPSPGREVGVGGGLGAGPIARTDVRGLRSRAANPGGREAWRLAKSEPVQKCTQPWSPGVDSHQAAAQPKVQCKGFLRKPPGAAEMDDGLVPDLALGVVKAEREVVRF
jgi:hypothetical protein